MRIERKIFFDLFIQHIFQALKWLNHKVRKHRCFHKISFLSHIYIFSSRNIQTILLKYEIFGDVLLFIHLYTKPHEICTQATEITLFNPENNATKANVIFKILQGSVVNKFNFLTMAMSFRPELII